MLVKNNAVCVLYCTQSFLGILRLHNSSLKVQGGHMIKARVIEVDKKKLTLDTGIKIAKISVADITPDCILHRKHEPDAPRQSQGQDINIKQRTTLHMALRQRS